MEIKKLLKNNIINIIITSLFFISKYFYKGYIYQTMFVLSSIIILFSIALFIMLIFKNDIRKYPEIGYINLNLLLSFLIIFFIIFVILGVDRGSNIDLVNDAGDITYLWIIYLILSLSINFLSKVPGDYIFFGYLAFMIGFPIFAIFIGLILFVIGVPLPEGYPILMFGGVTSIVMGIISKKIRS